MYKCAMCGKTIEGLYVMDEYVYKRFVQKKAGYIKTLYFCGWTCLRKFDHEKEIEDAKRRDRKNNRKSS